jgi:uncharacterized protein
VKAWMNRYPVLSFAVTAYIISWSLWLPVVLAGPTMPPWVTVFHILGGFGPFAAALIILFVGEDKARIQEYMKSLCRWQLPLRWYISALLIPVGIVLAAMALLLLLNRSLPGLAELPPLWVLPLMLVYMTLLGGGLEEPGWRGFALPRLLGRYQPLTASLILGITWGFWHLPLFLAPSVSQSNIPVSLFMSTGVGLSVLFSWFYLKTEGSTFMAVILHAAFNTMLNWYPLHPAKIEPFLPLTLVVTCIALAIAVFSPHFRLRQSGL